MHRMPPLAPLKKTCRCRSCVRPEPSRPLLLFRRMAASQAGPARRLLTWQGARWRPWWAPSPTKSTSPAAAPRRMPGGPGRLAAVRGCRETGPLVAMQRGSLPAPWRSWRIDTTLPCALQAGPRPLPVSHPPLLPSLLYAAGPSGGRRWRRAGATATASCPTSCPPASSTRLWLRRWPR